MRWRRGTGANHNPAGKPPVEGMQGKLGVFSGLESTVLPGQQPAKDHPCQHGARHHARPHDQQEQNGLIEIPPQEALLGFEGFGNVAGLVHVESAIRP